MASSGFDGKVIIRDPEDGEPVKVLQGHRVLSLAFSPDGQVLAGGTTDGSVVLWHTSTWEEIGEPLVGQRDWVNSVAFARDGDLLVAGSEDRTVFLWRSLAWEEDLATVGDSLCDVAARNLTRSEWNEFQQFQPYHRTC